MLDAGLTHRNINCEVFSTCVFSCYAILIGQSQPMPQKCANFWIGILLQVIAIFNTFLMLLLQCINSLTQAGVAIAFSWNEDY